MSPFVVLAASLFITVVATPLLRALSYRWNLLDVPNERSSHVRPTPRNGGYAIAGAMLVMVALVPARQDAGIAMIAAAADEVWQLSYALRLLLQIVIAVLATMFARVAIAFVDVPFGGRVSLAAIAVIVAVVWIVGVMNGFNFMDGLNGIATIEAIVCSATFWILFARMGDSAGVLTCAALIGAALGFLPWNFPSGSIFMGDVGSAPLGFMLSMLVLRLARGNVSFIAAALPLVPFLFDTAVTLVRRGIRGERLFSAHRSHFYQRLNQQGWSHSAVTALWAALAVMCSAVALVYDRMTDAPKVAALLLITAVHAGTAWWISSRDQRLIA